MVLMLLLLAGFWLLQAGLAAGVAYVEEKVEIVADLRDVAGADAVLVVQARGRRRRRRGAARGPRRPLRLEGRGARPLPGAPARARAGRPDRVPGPEPAPGQPRGEPRRPARLPAGRRPPLVARRGRRGRGRGPAAHRAPHLGDGRAPHRRHRRPRRGRVRRPLHHRQHDPAGGRRPARGDRDHAARRRLGRVHPLAVHLRGRVRRAAGGGGGARWSSGSPPRRSAR